VALLSIRNLSLTFGGHPLLDDIELQIERGDKLCLLGRNGVGKSTLMKIICREVTADSGTVLLEKEASTAYLPQNVPTDLSGTVFEVVAAGLNLSKESLAEKLNSTGNWEQVNDIEKAISNMKLNPEDEYSTLSAGLKRRTLLARALAKTPDILILDEPTNHLDIDSIKIVEEFLKHYRGTLFFVTHDRMFLKKLANKIVELDRGDLKTYTCDYDTYLTRRDEFLRAEKKERHNFDKKLAREEAWIREGIKARRTRNEGRVKSLVELRKTRSKRREIEGSVSLKANRAERSGKLVIEANNVSFSYDEAPIIKGFSTTIMRGDKIGIIGPNGCGKTTFVQLLLGEHKSKTGELRLGTNLEIAYFDQLRLKLDPNDTLEASIAEGADTVTINGHPRHVVTYLQDFLFTPDRCKSPIGQLSGGETNRFLIAKIFTKPANVLVFDEPTNDLDSDTIDLLEELLIDYPGTVIVVSHDRQFLNNVVTSTVAFEGEGKLTEYVGGYDDYQRQSESTKMLTQQPKKKKETPKKEVKKKLTYKENKELEVLPKQIEDLELEQEELFSKMSDPEFFKQSKDIISQTNERLASLKSEISVSYERWDYLENIKNG